MHPLQVTIPPNPWSDLRHAPQVPSSPPEPQGSRHPLGARAQEGGKHPQGSPRASGLKTACRDQGLGPWVGLVRDIPVTLEIRLGLFWLHVFALWKAQQTFIALCKQKIPCWMLSDRSKTKNPWPRQISGNNSQRERNNLCRMFLSWYCF